MPFCGWDGPCYTAESGRRDPELGSPWCHVQEPWGPELSPHAPSAWSRVGNLFCYCLQCHINPVTNKIVKSSNLIEFLLRSLFASVITTLFLIPRIKHNPKCKKKNIVCPRWKWSKVRSCSAQPKTVKTHSGLKSVWQLHKTTLTRLIIFCCSARTHLTIKTVIRYSVDKNTDRTTLYSVFNTI